MSWTEVKDALLNVSSQKFMDMHAQAILDQKDKVELTPLQVRLLQLPAQCKEYVHEVGLATACVLPANGVVSSFPTDYRADIL